MTQTYYEQEKYILTLAFFHSSGDGMGLKILGSLSNNFILNHHIWYFRAPIRLMQVFGEIFVIIILCCRPQCIMRKSVLI